MILNEDYGNLRQISSNILDFFKSNNKNNNIGRNSDVIVVKDNIQTYINNNINDIYAIIIRYHQIDLFLLIKDSDKHTNVKILKVKDNIEYYGYGDLDKMNEILVALHNNYFKNKIDYNTFISKLNYQVIFYDKDKIKKHKEREENLEKNNLYVYKYGKTQRPYGRDQKIHGKLMDKRDLSYYKEKLKERLKAYVESKFPNFDSLEDFENKKVNNFLKAFKINGNVYNYDATCTLEFNYRNFKRVGDALYQLMINKKGYAFYKRDNLYTARELPNFIIFEFVIDTTGRIYVNKIYGSDGYNVDLKDLKPLEYYNIKKDNANDINQNKNKIEDEEDW